MKIVSILARERIMIALDFPNVIEAEQFLSLWEVETEAKPVVKVGMQLFYHAGPDWVRKLKREGYTIFLDLKLHDIPHTVAGAVASVAQLGVDFLTIHASGGSEMMRAARQAIEQTNHSLQLLAVTQLTSTDQKMLNEEMGIRGTVAASVMQLAQVAVKSGMTGIVCSAHEVEMVKKEFPALLTVTPGIRLAHDEKGDQKRVLTPEEAVQRGADLLVVGRSITHSLDPKQAYDSILERLSHENERGERP
ncbi:orotidine-5'-phosphate decarboxylase [Mechercharimyces sp. CAU 1602]|uniref:orotidine-5'-phosphate decarboxylase n=1 Tax=Mechercharimyces sp. CAU 1602 TaxID=2973933 RepID=UPI002163B496|nr:orotidine-5'-phosphate decarboxylase [Mechercharimyces sp. CAU 1602]MCS1350652.1 orotidine-5'-phosphate decarboxylase [Mechercharimyces sp. CAU 1602]